MGNRERKEVLQRAHEAYRMARTGAEELAEKMTMLNLDRTSVLAALSQLREADQAVIALFGHLCMEESLAEEKLQG